LIAGGTFDQAGGMTVNSIARWNGMDWSDFTGPDGTGMNEFVYALAFQDGDLIAGGRYTKAGGETVNRIARWDGNSWSALSGPDGSGMNDAVFASVEFNGDLMAGGSFATAGGQPASTMARWRREATMTEILLIDPDHADVGDIVLVEARSEGPVSAPDSGYRGRIEADSGEFCDALVEPAGDNLVSFSCEITLTTAGRRVISAHYTGSARYQPSQSAAVVIQVTDLFVDRFETP